MDYAGISGRYEKLEGNVFLLKPIGRRPRTAVLTSFGRGVVFGLFVTIVLAFSYLFMK